MLREGDSNLGSLNPACEGGGNENRRILSYFTC